MALGFKKQGGLRGQDLGMLGGMGLAALGGPVAPLILAAMYSAQKDSANEAAKGAQREQDIQDFVSNKGGAGMDPSTGVNWNQSRPGNEAEQMQRLGRIAPEFMIERRAAEMFPTPMSPKDRYMNVPDVGLVDIGGAEPRTIIERPQPERPTGNRGWFTDGRSVFQAYENAPGTRANVDAGKWTLAQEPRRDDGITPVSEFQRNFGQLSPGMMPEVVDGRITGRQVPQVGGPQDPQRIEQERKEKLKLEAPGAKNALDTTTQFYDNVLSTIDRIKKNPNTRDVVGAWEGAGDGPWGLNPLTAQGNATAFTDIDNLQNMLQVQGLQVMRDASKTGGAVGSVTEREWPKLSARFGNLNRRQDEKAFLNQLTQIEKDFRESKQRIADTYLKEYGGIGDSSSGSIPTPQTPEDFAAIPSGSIYIDPDDGKQYRKP